MLSLNYADDFDEDGEKAELLEFLADDKAIDLDLRLDARQVLLGMPRRLIKIGYKRYSGQRLERKERDYLSYYCKKTQKSLFWYVILGLLRGDTIERIEPLG